MPVASWSGSISQSANATNQGGDPSGAPGRRQMPQFNLTDGQLDDLVEFLKWSNDINAEKWPPNIEG